MSEQSYQVPVRGHTRTVGGGGAGGSVAASPPAEDEGAPEQQGGWFSGHMIGGVPNWALIAGVAVLAIGYMWYRSRKASQAAAAQQQAAANPAGAVAGTTASAGGQCYDQSGNVVPCTQADYASQLAALQAEIDSLNGQASVPATYAPQTTAPTATATSVQPAAGATSTTTSTTGAG